MPKTKFTVRVDIDAFKAARQYAGQHETTVTRLVEEYFRSLAKVTGVLPETPILEELAGSLTPDVSEKEYRDYLEEKYLGDA